MSDPEQPPKHPQLTRAGLPPTWEVMAVDETGAQVNSRIAGEFPLTIYLDKREIVTLMTIGGHPEALTLGYLRNQRILSDIESVASVQVDFDVEAAVVTTVAGDLDLGDKLDKRTVTTGCGQGTMFGDLLADLDNITLPNMRIAQENIYALLKNLSQFNAVYKSAGAVHGCALCRKDGEIISFIEDVGRHNAVDAIAGTMWLDGESGEDKIFYTTGRLTSEMVIKVAQMGIPALLSRSGVTKMGLEIAQKTGVTLIARAKGRHFLVYHCVENVDLDPPMT